MRSESRINPEYQPQSLALRCMFDLPQAPKHHRPSRFLTAPLACWAQGLSWASHLTRVGMHALISLVLMGSALWLNVAKAAEPGHSAMDWPGLVTWVSDGDTVWVQDRAGLAHKVRLLGIDAPEICQDHGAVAKDALHQLLLGHHVTVQGRRYDDYGRLLARLYVGTSATETQDVGRWMVQQGHAWSYRYKQDPGPYVREEQRAREARLGLFASGYAQRPRDFRRQHGPCHEPWVPHS